MTSNTTTSNTVLYLILQDSLIFKTDHSLKFTSVTVLHETAVRITLCIQVEQDEQKFMKLTAKRNKETNKFIFDKFEEVCNNKFHNNNQN